MPIQHAIWKVGKRPIALTQSSLEDEKILEDMIEADPSILAEEWLIIGRQVRTAQGGVIDLLAIAPDGSLVIIELKRNRTPRDVVAQAIDYASWVQTLEADEISRIFSTYKKGENLADAFKDRFRSVLLEENLNQSHQIVVIAAELDSSTERIISYLSERNLAINALFFEVFSSENDQFLIRRWFVDPAITQINTSGADNDKEPWNGEFYVSWGEGETRSWEDARKYGFICAGGGAWYSRTLNMLSPGDRIWVRIPKLGYVGVGIVAAKAQSTSDFNLVVSDKSFNVLDVVKGANYSKDMSEENQEFFVKVDWIKTVDIKDAYDELGFFGNQNSVCRPTTSRWRSTVAKLKIHFSIS
ncbi:MAG TPA: endonuclease NucS domain-containing protein [Candidatus Paceibacterota bacterium]|nr:endonuclease NucS domain-containing protein [Candidatus Paceibacterota bacterium]